MSRSRLALLFVGAGGLLVGPPQAGAKGLEPTRAEYRYEVFLSPFDMGPVDPPAALDGRAREKFHESWEKERAKVKKGRWEAGRVIVEFSPDSARVTRIMERLRIGDEPPREHPSRLVELARRDEDEPFHWAAVPPPVMGSDGDAVELTAARFPHSIGTVYAPLVLGMVGWREIVTGDPEPEAGGRAVYNCPIQVGGRTKSARIVVEAATGRLVEIVEGPPDAPEFTVEVAYDGDGRQISSFVLTEYSGPSKVQSRRSYTRVATRKLSATEERELGEAIPSEATDGDRVVESVTVLPAEASGSELPPVTTLGLAGAGLAALASLLFVWRRRASDG